MLRWSAFLKPLCLFPWIAMVFGAGHARAEVGVVDLTLPVIEVIANDLASGFRIRNWADNSDPDPLRYLIEAESHLGSAHALGRVGLVDVAKADASGEYLGLADMLVEFTVEDPQQRPEIKSVLRFATAASVGALPADALPPGAVLNAWASAGVELGRSDGMPFRIRLSDGEIVSRPHFLSNLFALGVSGHRSRGRSWDGEVYWESGQCRATIQMNGQFLTVREQEGCGAESEGGRLGLTHAPGTYLMRVTADAKGNATAVSDPIWQPHPDNPDVVITRHAPSGIPDAPFAGTTPEELAARGIDPAPFIEGGFFGAPSIVVQPPALDYGAVAVTLDSDRTVVVRNIGTADLEITALGLTGASSFALVTPPTAPFTLAPNQTRDLTVRFRPTGAGTQTGTLSIDSNDSIVATMTVPLSGTGSVTVTPTTTITPTPTPTVTSTGIRDLAVVKLTAPKKVAQGSKAKKVVVQIQNRGTGPETITTASLGDGISSGLVRLSVPIVDPGEEACAAASIVLDPAKTLSKGVKILKPSAKLSVVYQVAYTCLAALPKKINEVMRGDYSHSATVFHAVLGEPDSHGADDTCPRVALGPDPSRPRITDRGCGAPLAGKGLGGAVLTNIVD